jgi:hypothetical protein
MVICFLLFAVCIYLSVPSLFLENVLLLNGLLLSRGKVIVSGFPRNFDTLMTVSCFVVRSLE